MSEMSLRQIDFEFTPDGVELINGAPAVVRGVHVAEDITYDDINDRLIEANDTYDVFKGKSGRPYEIVAVNTDKADQATVWKNSTSFSSILKNPGNMAEIALTAALNPDAQYVYIASFGNKPTGRMSRGDMKYLQSTGRYTRGDGFDIPYTPLAGVIDMAETAKQAFGHPTHLTADSEGSRLSLGLAAALEPNSIRGIYLNAPDGITHSANYIGIKLLDDFESRYKRRHQSDEKAGDLTPTGIENTKQHLSNVYRGIGRVAHLAPLPVFLFPGDVADKVRTTLAFRRNDDLAKWTDHAVLQDTNAALRQQNAPITMQFTMESGLHDLGDCIRFGELAMKYIPKSMRTPERRLRILISHGGVDHHTNAPHDRARTERLAFPDISHPLFRLAGGLSMSQIFDLPAVKSA